MPKTFQVLVFLVFSYPLLFLVLIFLVFPLFHHPFAFFIRHEAPSLHSCPNIIPYKTTKSINGHPPKTLLNK